LNVFFTFVSHWAQAVAVYLSDDVLSGLRGESEAQAVSDDECPAGWRSLCCPAGHVLLLLHEANHSSTPTTTTVADVVVDACRRARHY